MDEKKNNDDSSSDITVNVDGTVSEEGTEQSIPVTIKVEEPVNTETQQEIKSESEVADTEPYEQEIEVKQPPIVQEEDQHNDENDLDKDPETTPELATQAEPLSNAESVPQEPVVVEQPADIVTSKDTPLVDNVESRLSSMNSEPAEVGVAASQMNKPAHPNNKKLAVVVTVIVALLMSVTAIYVYLSTNKNAEESKEETTSQSDNNSTQSDIAPATTEDIDSAGKDVEEVINSLDEEEDFPEEDISDSSLGL